MCVRINNIALFLTLLVAALAGCSNQKPAIVVDAMWHRGFAKSSCEQTSRWHEENAELIAKIGCKSVAACADMMPRVEACSAPDQVIYEFENELAMAFATNPNCSSIEVVSYRGPESVRENRVSKALGGDHWLLIVDLIPGTKLLNWSVRRNNINPFLNGEDPVPAIAGKVCAIATGKGASVGN